MPWDNTPAGRAASAKTYSDPVYQANKRLALRRASGRCEQCSTSTRRLQVDHAIPVSQGGSHALTNLRVLCAGPGSCHARKTASEGGGYRRPASDPPPNPRTTW